MIIPDLSHINTEEFSPEAKRFNLNALRGFEGYIDAPRGTLEWKEYWDEQEYYCKNGYSVGGVRITGEHYFYLNFCQIHLKETAEKENITKSRRKVEKKTTFPAFWDSDYFYFHECEAARENGEHMIIVKPRRRGYSYKNAAKCAYNYTFVRKSTSLVLSEQDKYTKETMGMAVDYLDFLLKYTDFGKQRQQVNRRYEEVMASYVEKTADGREIVGGFKSRIMGFTALNNPDVARGKDANVILFEEAGSFGNLLATYRVTRATVEEGTDVSGQIFVYGTGGDFTGGQVDFEKMFYDPETYGCRAYENIYDDGKEGTFMGYFLPDYYSKGGFIDKQGISQINDAKNYIEAKTEKIKRTSKDPNEIDSHLAEFPTKPSEAFIKVGTNVFPKAEINQQINDINANKQMQYIGVPSILFTDTTGRVKCEPNDDVKPILNFPYKPGVDGTGCVLIYQPPFTISNVAPDNLYFIAVDPYAIDKGKDKKLTKRDSLGAAYVFKRVNNFSKPYDMIVAEYVARPEMQDDFNKNLFLLAEYYNAKIVFENDRDGDILAYARVHKLLHRLEEEVTVYDSNDSPRKKLGRSYGVSMSNIEVKKQAVGYLRDWLLTKRELTEDGEQLLNLHRIFSVPLLSELLKFSYEGNYDRVSALLVGMLYKKELLLKPPVEERQKSAYNDPFFSAMDIKLGINKLEL